MYIRTEKGLEKMTDEQYEAYQESKKPELTYVELREYPPVGDQLDAIMKWLATESEFGIPAELKSIAGKCMAEKSKHPKPVTEEVE